MYGYLHGKELYIHTYKNTQHNYMHNCCRYSYRFAKRSYIYIDTFIRMYVPTCMHAYTVACTAVGAARSYTYIHIFVRTYIHTYIHTLLQVRLLLRQGADIDRADYDSRTVLHCSCAQGNAKVLFCAYICVCVCVCVCMYACMHECMHIYIYIYIYMN